METSQEKEDSKACPEQNFYLLNKETIFAENWQDKGFGLGEEW